MEMLIRPSSCHSESEEPASTPAFNGNSPAPEKTETDGLSLVWKHYENAGISNDVLEVIKNSWRELTRSQYAGYMKQWEVFCVERHIDRLHPSLNDVLAFLCYLHNKRLSYSAINTARSALSYFFDY